MRHLDLFSGIGGFALAAEMVWPKINHTFVEYDPFCQAVLKKHWPEATIHADIRDFVADSTKQRSQRQRVSIQPQKRRPTSEDVDADRPHILTGGFPCQPFSHAGRRKGTADDRYLWPAMLESIALFNPRWVIAENVAGLASWSNGLVLETVCADLEKEGYEVCPFVIPACAAGAPHKRDRIWIIAHRNGRGLRQQPEPEQGSPGTAFTRNDSQDAPDAGLIRSTKRWTAGVQSEREESKRANSRGGRGTWTDNWPQVATRLCRVDDGIPRRMDRNPRLKALGNAIVPQVAAEIMRAIRIADESPLPHSSP